MVTIDTLINMFFHKMFPGYEVPARARSVSSATAKSKSTTKRRTS